MPECGTTFTRVLVMATMLFPAWSAATAITAGVPSTLAAPELAERYVAYTRRDTGWAPEPVASNSASVAKRHGR